MTFDTLNPNTYCDFKSWMVIDEISITMPSLVSLYGNDFSQPISFTSVLFVVLTSLIKIFIFLGHSGAKTYKSFCFFL